MSLIIGLYFTDDINTAHLFMQLSYTTVSEFGDRCGEAVFERVSTNCP